MKTGALLNGLTLFALALAASVWTMFFFASSGPVLETGIHYEGEFPLNEPFTTTEVSSFTLNGKDGLLAMPDTELEVTWDGLSSDLSVNLASGTLFAYTLADELRMTVNSDLLSVTAQNNFLILTVDESTQDHQIYSIEHPALLEFLAADGEVMNTMSTPGSYRMKVSAAKVTPTLAKLRFTKLSKEFPVYPISDGDLKEEWQVVLTEIRDSYDESSVAFLNQVQEESAFGPALTGLGSQLSSGLSSFQDALTVVPTAELRLEASRKADYLKYAMSNYLYADAATGDFWLKEWKALEQDFSELRALYSSLFFVLPGDELYPVKAATAELLFPHEDPMLSLRRSFAEVESLLSRASQVDAQKAFSDYKTQFETLLNSGAFDSPESLSVITREYALLELLLRSHSVFYSADVTHLLTALEEKILILAGSDADLDEERQAFVQSKLRFLSNLFAYVLDQKISISVASSLAEELIYEADSYLNEITTAVAVQSYFESKLAEYVLSVQFMNSPEFSTYDSFEEGLADYKLKVADLAELNAYIQNLREGEEQDTLLTLDEAVKIAEDDLYAHGIQFSELVSLEDGAYRLFEIEGARTAGFSFNAKYDRESQILYDVVVGEIRFSTGLTLESASLVIELAVEEVSAPEEEQNTEDDAGEETASLTEKVALELVASQFEAAGLDPERFTFHLVDLAENEFTFDGTASAFNLSVSASYDADTKRVSEIVWLNSDEPQTLPDLDLAELEAALEAAHTAVTE